MRIVGNIARVGIGGVEIELDRGESGSGHGLAALAIRKRIGRRPGMAIGIDANLVPISASEEVVDRRIQRPAHQIPTLLGGNTGFTGLGERQTYPAFSIDGARMVIS